MKTGPALALIAAGAILVFAVPAHPRFFSFQTAGWVIMLTGIAGLVIPAAVTAGCAASPATRAPRRG